MENSMFYANLNDHACQNLLMAQWFIKLLLEKIITSDIHVEVDLRQAIRYEYMALRLK